MEDRQQKDRQHADRRAAVSRGTVSRAATGAGRSAAAGSQSGKPQAGSSQRASQGHAKRPSAAASRPQSASAAAGKASGRPQSASAAARKNASTGRVTERTGTSQHRKAESDRRKAQTAGRRKTGSSGSGQRKPQYQLDARKVIPAAVILGVILALVISAVMRAGMLRVRQIETDYEAGDIFAIENFFQPVNDNAKVTYDGEFKPEKLGKCTVRFKVTRGKMSKTKKGRINVVDSVSPYIEGPDEINIPVGTEINWSDYYNVTDSDPDIQSALKSETDVDTSKVKITNAVLTVTDWAGNTSTKVVTVNITQN